jgi:succinyl-CoA synthetase alpha subunit
MSEKLAAQGMPPAGFLVEEQAAAGVEVIAGLIRDPGFGPVLLAGLGGVWTEVLRDSALGICPVSETGVRRMLASLRGSPLLHGHRGAPAVDLDALVGLLLRLGGEGGLWETLELGEFELNPVIATPEGVIAVDARHIPPGPEVDGPAGTAGAREAADFTPLFEPRAVAVVGASTSRPNFGNMFLEFYKATGVPLVAVHPEAAEIGGVAAVPTLAAARSAHGVEYALVAVPAARCADVVRQAAGIPFVQVMSGGFAEMGDPGLERELAAAAREAGTRLLGPNCMGVYCPQGRQTFVGGAQGRPGNVAMISQSGGLAGEVIKVGERRGLAFSRVATVGNCADVTPAELLRWLGDDPLTAAVGLYLEDPRDGRALLDALMSVRGRLPVVMLVGGRSGQGRAAAASHTGGLVGDGRVWQALADQTGAALVTSQDDLIGTLAFCQSHATRLGRHPSRTPGEHPPGTPAEQPPGTPGEQPPGTPAEQPPGTPGEQPPGTPGEEASWDRGVLIVGPSGGASVLAADVFDGAGLTLGPLPEPAGETLRALGLGAGSSPANPLEVPVGPRARPGLVRDVVHAIMNADRRPYSDVVAHVNVQSFFTYGDTAEPLYEYARHLAELQRDLPATRITLVTRNGECAPPGVEDEVRAIVSGIPVYRSMEAASVAVAAGRRFSP